MTHDIVKLLNLAPKTLLKVHVQYWLELLMAGNPKFGHPSHFQVLKSLIIINIFEPLPFLLR